MKASQLGRSIFDGLVSVFGTNLIDYRTGEWIAKALIFSWKGHIYLIGMKGRDQVIPVFLPQEKMSFWKRRIGFTTHPAPDFPSEAPSRQPS